MARLPHSTAWPDGDLPVRVLITARDAGAGHQSRAFVDAALARGAFEFHVLAQDPAARSFAEGGVRCSIAESDIDTHIERAFEAFAPDFVLAGLSGFDGGVDEAALVAARRRGVATGSIQDYWGYLGPVGSTLRPDVFFVLDERARELTLQRTGGSVETRVTGSPKHEGYAARLPEWMASRRDTGHPRLVFFLQPREVPGIVNNAEIFLMAAGRLRLPVSVTLRLHPADDDPAFYAAMTARLYPAAEVARPQGPIEAELCRTDVVVTCFSTVGLDHNYLQAFSAHPIGCLAYVAAGEPVRAFMREVIGSDRVPGAEVGMGAMLHSLEELAGWMEEALTGDRERERYADAVRRNLGIRGRVPSDHIAAYIESVTRRHTPRNIDT